MDTKDLENNVVQFERTPRAQDRTTPAAEGVPLTDAGDEQSNCADGVCVIAWKPRRPPTVAA